MSILCRSATFFWRLRYACASVPLMVCSLGQASWADDFRIDTQVFVGDQGQPHSETTTLFHQGLVYDFLSQPPETTVFDPAAERFVRLDPNQHTKVELSLPEIDDFMHTLEEEARASDQPFLRFLANPRFTEQWSPAGNTLQMGSPFMTYRLETVTCRNESISRQYAEFSNAYARLNTLTNPASLPPFPRLAVNAALARRGVLPKRVALTIVTQTKPTRKEVRYQSRHDIRWRLTAADLERIHDTQSLLEASREVEPVAFHQPIDPRRRKE